MDAGIWGWIILFVVLVVTGGVVLFLFWYIWQMVGTSIKHWFIKMNSNPAEAVILEAKKVGSAFGVNTANIGVSSIKEYQPVRLKLEVHPKNGAPYIAQDRFNADIFQAQVLTPGTKIQVSAYRLNPYWVASLPETAVYPLPENTWTTDPGPGLRRPARPDLLKHLLDTGRLTQQEYELAAAAAQSHDQGSGISIPGNDQANDPKAEMEKLKQMLVSGLITQQDYDKKKDDILSKM